MLSEFGNKARSGSTVDLLEAGLLEGPEKVQQGQVQDPASGTCWPCATGQPGVANWEQLVATSFLQIRSVHLQQRSSTISKGGILKSAANRASTEIPALSLALARLCLGRTSSFGLPSTRQSVTDGPRGATMLELGTWKERPRDAESEKKTKGFFIAACSSLLRCCGEMEMSSDGTRSSVTSCKKGNFH